MARLTDYTLTTNDAAQRLGVNPKTFARWAARARIPSVETPTGWRKYRPEDIDAFEQQLIAEGRPVA